MKNWKKIICTILLLAVSLTGLPGGMVGQLSANLTGRKTVQAGVRQVYDSAKAMSKTVSLDLTGDGKKEKVSFEATMRDEWSIGRLVVKVDGTTALSLSKMIEAYVVEASYLKISDTEAFLWIKDMGSNDDSSVDQIYRYDASTEKLKRVLLLDSANWRNGGFHIYSSVKAGGNVLKVTYQGQTMATGHIVWTYVYQYKNDSFTLKSSTAKITSQAHEGDFVAAKKLKFYKKPGSQTVAFTLPAGQSAKLKKIRTYKKTYYLQFQYGKKTGWISSDQGEIFKDVMLAG